MPRPRVRRGHDGAALAAYRSTAGSVVLPVI
jgi:hypothetical protein